MPTGFMPTGYARSQMLRETRPEGKVECGIAPCKFQLANGVGRDIVQLWECRRWSGWMKSLKGQLLLASARLQDPNFLRSVVFLVQHGEEGALGLILNRPLETTVRQVCEQVSAASCAIEGQMHQGGPCEGLLM